MALVTVFRSEHLKRSKVLHNGTVVRLYDQGTEIILPSGDIVHGEPHDTMEYRQHAVELGYGTGEDAALNMALDHDPLHAMLADWLGLRTSHSLSNLVHKTPLGLLEEAAVLAVQKYMRSAGGRLPW